MLMVSLLSMVFIVRLISGIVVSLTRIHIQLLLSLLYQLNNGGESMEPILIPVQFCEPKGYIIAMHPKP